MASIRATSAATAGHLHILCAAMLMRTRPITDFNSLGCSSIGRIFRAGAHLRAPWMPAMLAKMPAMLARTTRRKQGKGEDEQRRRRGRNEMQMSTGGVC